MSETLREALPGIYASLLPAFFDTAAPAEPKATCGNCAMCAPAGAPAAGVVSFRPDTKCCTYFPRLPNYLVGAILRDADLAEGGRRLRARIEGRLGVTPRWLAPPRKRSLLFQASRASSFGRSRALLCPYYDDAGLCTIWRHRESECSTFFCKYAAGADGQAFWRGVGHYLARVEARLADHAARALAPDLVEPPLPDGTLTLDELEDRPPSDYATIWGAWEGREEAFYLACHDVVAALGPDEFARVVDADEPLAALAESHRRMLAPTLPERLVLAPGAAPQPFEDGVLVATYSRYEPIKLTPALHEVLKDLGPGETVAEVRARLLRDHEVDVPEELLVALHQLRVLVAT